MGETGIGRLLSLKDDDDNNRPKPGLQRVQMSAFDRDD
jgi:hypothetical protein